MRSRCKEEGKCTAAAAAAAAGASWGNRARAVMVTRAKQTHHSPMSRERARETAHSQRYLIASTHSTVRTSWN